MDTFYCQDIKIGLCQLPESESHHAARVLRKKLGQPTRLIDGKGTIGEGIFDEIHKKSTIVRIEKIVKHPPASSLHIAIAPTKNLDRLEWFLEKSTELGIRRITPILCKHSERKIIKKERLEKVILAATKQSLNAFMPILDDLTPFKDFLDGLATKYTHKYIAYCGDGPSVDISEISKHEAQTIVLIGPEGDFSTAEHEFAISKGFIGLTLGTSRLRTETAGIFVAAAFRLAQNNKQ